MSIYSHSWVLLIWCAQFASLSVDSLHADSCQPLLLTSSSLQITNRSFRYASPHLWNYLPSSFCQPHSVHCPPGSPHLVHLIKVPVFNLNIHRTVVSLLLLKPILFHKSFPLSTACSPGTVLTLTLMAVFYGRHLVLVSCADLVVSRQSRLCYSVASVAVCRQQNTKRIWPYSSSRSSKVIDFGVNGKPICDFILVNTCNFSRICYRFRDIRG